MEVKNNSVTQNNEDFISQLWAKFFPYWPVYLILCLLFLGGAWLYIQYKLPVYESTATILIKDERKGTEDSKVTESLDLLSSKKIVENEIEVLKSGTIMTQVVKDLKLYAPIFEKGKWKDVSAYATSPVSIEVKDPDSLIEADKVQFSYDEGKRSINIKGQNYPLNYWVVSPWGNIRFSVNNRAYSLHAPLYFTLVRPKRVTIDLISRLVVTSTNKLASVINLKIKDEVPKRSEDILNSLISIYDKASVNDKNFLAENTLAFLDERLKSVSTELNTIEKQLQQYKANNGAIDISSQSRLFLGNVSENDQKLSDVNMKLAVLAQIEQYISSNDNQGGLVPSTLGIDDPLIIGLLNKLYEAELQYEKLRSTTGENNVQLLSIKSQIEKIKPSILNNVISQKQSLEAAKSNLYATNSSYKNILHGLPQQERDIVEITREQNIKSGLYSFLLQKREETALSYSSAISDSRVVDQAVSSLEPVGLKNMPVYAIALVVALGLGISLVTAREAFSHTILFRREIEALTSSPVIGEIVYENSKNPIVFQSGNTSFIAEQFRMLRTTICNLETGKKGTKILITSTISGEGKSFIAANLGLSLSMAGKKVVLVEFDLSNPTLVKKFSLSKEKGVSDYLKGGVEPSEIIKKSQENENLYLISAGNLSATNPSDLIMSDRSRQLLEYLEDKFDYILVDTAPVGLLSDGYVLSKLCDTTLYIVRHRNTPRKRLERLVHNNQANDLKNLMIVFNGIRPRGFGFSKNGYGYGYGYGHSYVDTLK